MLSALQGQLELGDCDDHLSVQEYQSIVSHCLPSRLITNISLDKVLQHHQSLQGMSGPQAKKAFLSLIQAWPLYKATIFDVMQSFTSNWPRILWLAVDQKGLHLLEHRSRNNLCTFEYTNILSYSPAMNCLMIITGSDKKQSKVILTTSQVRLQKLTKFVYRTFFYVKMALSLHEFWKMLDPDDFLHFNTIFWTSFIINTEMKMLVVCWLNLTF